MSGKFVLEKGSTGTLHFGLQAANGQVIDIGQQMTARDAASSPSGTMRPMPMAG
jgi:uncharacterized protein YegP (UPF0339 family)